MNDIRHTKRLNKKNIDWLRFNYLVEMSRQPVSGCHLQEIVYGRPTGIEGGTEFSWGRPAAFLERWYRNLPSTPVGTLVIIVEVCNVKCAAERTRR